MKILKINIRKYTREDIDLIVDYFKQGKIIAYPTDTIYGLGGIATSIKVVDKIYKIKKRDKKKPFILLVNSFKMVKKYCYISQKQAEYLKKVWPGAVSIVLESKRILPKEISGGRDTLTVRMPKKSRILGRDLPKNDFLTTIISRVNTPLISTSLNISDSSDRCIITGEAEDFFNPNLIDLSINVGSARYGRPSRITDIRDINNIKILRK